MSFWFKAALVMVILLGAMAGAGVAGYVIGERKVFPYPYVKGAENSFAKRYRSVVPYEPPAHKRLQAESILLQLEGEGVLVPIERPGTGGGVTSFGDAVVLLTYDGQFFSARSASGVEPLRITPPDNGWHDYDALRDSPDYADYDIESGALRYDAVEYFKMDDSQGLAISYSYFNKEAVCYQRVVATLQVDAGVAAIEEVVATADDWEILFASNPCLPLKKEWRAIEGHIGGGRLAFRAPGTLYLANGDYSLDGMYAPQAIAQDPAMDYGKVFEIDMRTRQATTLSRGHRNTQGIAVTPDGQVWVVEHGPRGGDELNAVFEGANFGWPLETLGTTYVKTPWPLAISYGRHDTFDPPVFAWVPSVATSSMTVISGFSESWAGDFIIGSLKDQSLHRVRADTRRALFAERIYIGERIRDVHEHTDGRLVLWTDSHYLYFVEEADLGFVGEFVAHVIDKQSYDDRTRKAVQTAITSCMECHSFDQNDSAGAPSLAGIFDRVIAGSAYAGYSDGLASLPGRWSRDNLTAFVQDPAAFAPGTTMPDPGIDDPEIAAAVVTILEALRQTVE